MVTVKNVFDVDEAIKILLDLIKTPQLCDIHFEFDARVEKAPSVSYTIKRFAVKTNEK